MANPNYVMDTISIDQIFLDNDNPRHDPYETQGQVIDYLCNDEYVLQIARDIAKVGLNPLELWALLPIGDPNDTRSRTNYLVAEGNRRMCAIMLLNDPELAPSKLKQTFVSLSKTWEPIVEVPCIIFDDRSDVSPWLDRLHGDARNGVGRRKWDAEQKARHTTGNKNKPAQAFLDYAEAKGFISSTDRSGKITTVQRYIGNTLFKDAMGIDANTAENLQRNRPRRDFDQLAEKFIDDLIAGRAHSRQNKKEIDAYARRLNKADGISDARIKETPITPPSGLKVDGKIVAKPPRKPKRPRQITYDEEISEALEELGNAKLISLYHSIHTLQLSVHTPLIAIGVWAIFEILTAICGRKYGNSFVSYYSKDKIVRLGFNEKKSKTFREALERVMNHGNTTKHDDTAANFYDAQLANDVDTLKPLIIKSIEEARDATSSR